MSRRRRRVVPIAVAAVVAAVGAGAVGLSFTPVFDAEQVLVRGTVHLRAGQVRRISGLAVGTNVLHVDLDAAMRRLRRNAWVAEATASRELPATIIVEIRERVPVGTLISADRRALVMADGTVIEGRTVSRLPRIFIRGGAYPPDSLAAVAGALGALSEGVHRQVSAASIRPDGSLVLQLRRGAGITYGPPTELTPKARAVEELLRWAEDRSIRLTMLDVTVPQAPTARTAGADIEL